MKIETSVGLTGTILTAYLEKFGDKAVLDALTEAVQEIAKQYVKDNMDKITAKLDLTGLANLIAIYAAKNLAEGAKTPPA